MEKIEFSLDLYNTGKYDVVTREDEPVEIKFTNGRERDYPIRGYIDTEKDLESWNRNGRFVDGGGEQDEDLFLVEKEQPVEQPITIKGRKLADYIKDEANNFRQVLKDNGIDFQPDDIYWENYARQFMALVEEKGTLPSEEQPKEQPEEINEALVWAAMTAVGATMQRYRDIGVYRFADSLNILSGEGSTPYAAAVELYKKLKGE